MWKRLLIGEDYTFKRNWKTVVNLTKGKGIIDGEVWGDVKAESENGPFRLRWTA